jgi:hypothetical protein
VRPARSRGAPPPPPPPPPRALGLAIYVYELPAEFNMLGVARWAFLGGGDPIYSAELYFLDLLLRDGGVRTLDPEAADLFYVPTFAYYGAQGNTGSARAPLDLAIHYIRTGPYARWWERRGGRDHVRPARAEPTISWPGRSACRSGD